MPVVRILRLPPDPLVLARALGGRPGLAVLVSRPQGAPRPEDARWSFVACEPVEASDDLVPPPGGDEPGGDPAPRWIGVVPYEALRSQERPSWTRRPDHRPPASTGAPAWRRYAAVLRVDHVTGEVAAVGDDDRSVAALVRAVGSARPSQEAMPADVRPLPRRRAGRGAPRAHPRGPGPHRRRRPLRGEPGSSHSTAGSRR